MNNERKATLMQRVLEICDTQALPVTLRSLLYLAAGMFVDLRLTKDDLQMRTQQICEVSEGHKRLLVGVVEFGPDSPEVQLASEITAVLNKQIKVGELDGFDLASLLIACSGIAAEGYRAGDIGEYAGTAWDAWHCLHRGAQESGPRDQRLVQSQNKDVGKF